MGTDIVGIERTNSAAKFVRSELRQARAKIRSTAEEGEKRAERLYIEVLEETLTELKRGHANPEAD